MPAVSVLLPCYNAGQTLERALESLTHQTLTDLQVIAVDDGSQDETPGILDRWARRDRRLQVISREHRGLIPSLNEGLALCTAPYVARMDADDLAHPPRLARQRAYLDAHPEVTVVSCLVRGAPPDEVRMGFRIYINWLNSLVTDEDIRREIFIESPLPHPSVMFRRKAVERVAGYQDNGWAEDYDLWLRLYLAGARFGKVPEYLLDWYENPHRLTRTDPRYSLENFLRAKAHYLARGPLADRDAVILWGAGMTGRRLSKHLLRQETPLIAFVDIDPRKIGRTRRGLPILSPEDLPVWWRRFSRPAVLAAVGARGARPLIRARLTELGLKEGQDWWCAA
jgi:glycosyltransferase involved in cell wall biosynthesis